MNNGMETPDSADVPPWHRQFWPWFLLVLPGTVVVASLVTVGISFYHSDTLVRDDYYREGLAINRELALEREALARGIRATLDVHDGGTISLLVESRAQPEIYPQSVEMTWQHPVESSGDRSLLLQRVGPQRYLGELSSAPVGRWYLSAKSRSAQLSDDAADSGVPASATREWQLKKEIVVLPFNADDTAIAYQSFELAPLCDGVKLTKCGDD